MLREARTQDSKIRESFQHIRRSVGGAGGEGTYSHVLGVSTIGGGGARGSMGAESSTGSAHPKRGVKLRASTTYDDFNLYDHPPTHPTAYPHQASQAAYVTSPTSMPASASSSKRRSRSKEREVTLLESGMIMERVDIQREEREEKERRRAEEREERRRTRKVSRVSTTGIPSGYGSGVGATMSDASSMHSLSAPMQSVNYGGSRSQISLIAAPPSIAGKRMSSPMILTPPRPAMTRGTSQSSVESRGTPRFFGFRHWNGAYGSEASQHANSGSMVDMQYAQVHLSPVCGDFTNCLPVTFLALALSRTAKCSMGHMRTKAGRSVSLSMTRSQKRVVWRCRNEISDPASVASGRR